MSPELRTDSLEITVGNLAEVAASLRELFGEMLFTRMLGGYDSAAAKGLADHVQRAGRAHPFAVAWDDLVKGAERSKAQGAFQLSEQAFLLLDSLHSFSTAQDDPEFENLLKRLVGADQFFSTSFEAFTYSAYRSMGVAIALVPEAAELGERRPDLVSLQPEGAVYLECKSLQDDVRVEERIWSEVEARVVRSLDKASLNLRLRIEASRRLGSGDVQLLADAASDLISNNAALRGTDLDGVALTISQIMPQGGTIPLPLDLPRGEGERIWVETEVDADTNLVRKVWLIESKPHADAEQGDRLVRLFRDAASQLPRASPSVVHLQVPYRAATHFLDVVDRARPQLERVLARSEHVCAVVISGRFLNKRMADDEAPIANSHVVIPNFRCMHALPPEFRLLGSTDMSRLPGEMFEGLHEGTFLVQFNLNEPMQAQLGRYILRHCSRDGRRQMNVWQTYRNRFRIEVVHDAFGRRELTLDLNHLTVGAEHKIAFSWGDDGIRCSVDGSRVEHS